MMQELIPQAVNFFALVALLIYFLRKPAIEGVAKRQEMIRKDVEEARLLKLDAEKKFKEFEKKLNDLESEAREIISKAEVEAKKQSGIIIENAKVTATRIIKDAEQSAANALSDSRTEIKRQVVTAAIEAAEKMIRENTSKDDQKRILNDYVGKVN